MIALGLAALALAADPSVQPWRILFRIWGQPLGMRRLASFRSGSPVRAYVGGRRVEGPVGAIRLTPHAQIVLELGPYVPPHPSFLFPGDAP